MNTETLSSLELAKGFAEKELLPLYKKSLKRSQIDLQEVENLKRRITQDMKKNLLELNSERIRTILETESDLIKVHPFLSEKKQHALIGYLLIMEILENKINLLRKDVTFQKLLVSLSNPNKKTESPITEADIKTASTTDLRTLYNFTKNKALCPFHKEKTPSLSVNKQGNLWHCFACGKGGDTIEFIRQVEKKNFVETVKYLVGK